MSNDNIMNKLQSKIVNCSGHYPKIVVTEPLYHIKFLILQAALVFYLKFSNLYEE